MSNGYIPKNTTSSENSDNKKSGHLSIHGIIDDIKKIKNYHYVDTYGFGVAKFINATHMFYQSIPVEHEVGYDSFWIVKREEDS